MIFKPVLILLFWALAIYGMFDVIRRTRKMRAPRKYKEFIFAWRERSVSGFQADTVSWLATSIHWIVAFIVGLVEFFTLAVRPWSADPPSFLSITLIGGFIGGIGYTWGGLLFTPIGLSVAGNRHCALSAEGVLYADNLIPWSAFSHFSVDQENSIIHLWSSSFRGGVGFVFTPPAEHFTKIVGLLHNYLPDENMVSAPGPLWQWTFPLVVAAGCCIPFLIAVPLTFLLSTEMALIVNGILLYALMMLGGPALLWALFGRKMRPAAVEQ